MAVVQLEEFFRYKNQLINDMLTNKEIVKLLAAPDEKPKDAPALVYSQVFPYEYVPDTIEHAQTFVCCDVDIDEVQSKTYLSPTLYIWVFTHKSLLRLPQGGVRTDRLCEEIAKTINGSRYYGLGELGLKKVRRFAPIVDYQGKVLTFSARDFNRVSPSGRSAPTNRRDAWRT